MSFICLLIYLFLTFIRPQEWVHGILNAPLVDAVSIALLIFLFFERMASKNAGLLRVAQNGLMFGLFLAILMSHVAHTYFQGMIEAFNLFIINIILYFIVLNAINTERKFRIAIWFIVLLILLLVPQGMYQVAHGYGWAGQGLTIDPHNPEVRINWVGIFSDPNDLALTFVMAAGIVLAFIFGKTGIIPRLLSSTMLGYFIYGIFLSNSRGGLVAIMVTVYFYFVRRTRRFILGSIIGGLLAIGLFAIGPSRSAIISSGEASANNRVQLWYQGILMMKANPLFGVGFRMFEADQPQTAHNSFVLAASELGSFGYFFWMALIFSSFRQLSLVQQYDERLRTYATGLQTSLVGFCAAAFFLSRTYVILPYLLFALSGSLFYIAQQRNKELIYRFTLKEARSTFLFGVIVLIVMYVIVKITL